MLKKFIKKFSANNNDELKKIIYNMFHDKVYRSIYYITKDHNITQDILQETFIKAFNKLESIEDPEKIGAWLTTIAIRTTNDYFNKNNKIKTVYIDNEIIDSVLVKDFNTVEKTVELSLLKEQIAKKIDELQYNQREVFVLKYYLNYS